MYRLQCRIIKALVIFVLLIVIATGGTAAGKSVYLAANHHTAQFDAWNIGSDGKVSKQATYNLHHSTDPAGIGIDAITPDNTPIMFISSEFSGGLEVVNPVTLEYIGVSSGPRDLAGVDVDDVDDIVFGLRRQTRTLYIYQWDYVARTMTQLAVVSLPGMSYGLGIAFDDARNILWVTDTPNHMVRAYDVDVASWTDIVEVPSLSFATSLPPIDITVDSRRNIVYTVGGWANSPLLSKYDVTHGVETTVDCGAGMSVAVDDITGYVYITRGLNQGGGGMDDIQVWDCSTSPFTLIQDTERIGDPAGLAIANVSYNPLDLAKNDAIQGHGVYLGQTFPYEISFNNYRHVIDVTNVMVRDDLPDELDFISESVDGHPGTGVYDPTARTVTWDIGTIPAGQPGPEIELVVRVNNLATPGDTIFNFCNIWCDQFDTTTVPGGDPDNPDPDEPGTQILPAVPVALDIKPQSCPNPLNIKWLREADPEARSLDRVVPTDTYNGERAPVLPVAILGTADFDVRSIDPATLLLEGVPPLRWMYEDISTPMPDDAEECECHTTGADGYIDLTIKFDKESVILAIGDVANGDVVPLTINGELSDSVPVIGTDCVTIRANRSGSLFPVSEDQFEADLEGNYPNPFNPSTNISFTLPEECDVKLEIYNILGRKVATLVNGVMEAGQHTVVWDSDDAASGVYFYRLTVGTVSKTKKMLLVR